MFTIYKIKNEITGKFYIGFTTKENPKQRFLEHCSASKKESTSFLHQSMSKHGVENFSFEVLKQGSDSEWGLKVEEPYYIGMWKPEYNNKKGANGIWVHSDETRAKMSATHKLKGNGRLGKPSPVKGRPLSEEHKRNLSIAAMGKNKYSKTEEHKRKLSLSQIGKPKPGRPKIRG
jgi:group I intron endonuclease